MQRKKRFCKGCESMQYIFSRHLCLSCWRKENKPQISKVSENEKERQIKYIEIVRRYLLEHPICEVCHERLSQEIHHKKGRIGLNLFKYFLAVCRICHLKIEANPEWAKENNYTISRL